MRYTILTGLVFSVLAGISLNGCSLFSSQSENGSESDASLETHDGASASAAPAAASGTKASDPTVEKSEPKSEAKTERKVAASPKSEAELREARLYARIDELEEQLKRQKERMVVLERGLVTGLVPEELKDKPAGKATGKETPKENKDKKEADKPAPAQMSVAAAAPAKAGDDAELKKRQQVAQDHFKNGRYGKAIVEYTDIGKVFGEKADQGSHMFWIGRSWAGLRDYQNSRANLLEFINSNPQSPLVPRAKLELARAEARLGLKDTAVKRLRDVIQSHPNEDAAEMAKMELASMQKNL